MTTLNIVLIDNGEIPHDIHLLSHATNWEQQSAGCVLVVILQLDYLGDEHLNTLDGLYKRHEILAWVCGEYSSANYNL